MKEPANPTPVSPQRAYNEYRDEYAVYLVGERADRSEECGDDDVDANVVGGGGGSDTGDEQPNAANAEEPGEQEAQEPLPVPQPDMPTREEVRRHRLTHMPFRRWCPHCVAGQARDRQHKRKHVDPPTIPTGHIDFCFFGDGDQEEAGEASGKGENVRGNIPGLIFTDEITSMKFATVLPHRREESQWGAEKLKEFIDDLGYTRIVIKSDQEPAIIALRNSVKRLGIEVVPENSPAGEHQANGRAERAVQTIEMMVRTLKLNLEERLGRRFSMKHPIMSWLVLHAADNYNRFALDTAGRTPYQRWKGRPYRGQVLEFASRCHFRFPFQRGGIMRERWGVGVWLGKSRRADEHLIWHEGEVHRAHAVRTFPEEESWDWVLVDGVTGHPWPKGCEGDPAEPAEPLDEPLGTPAEAPPSKPRDLADPIPRVFPVKRQHLRRFGYSKGCRKCTMIRRGDESQPTLGHSPECRARMHEEMAKTPEFRDTIEAAENKQRAHEKRRRQDIEATDAEAGAPSQAEHQDQQHTPPPPPVNQPPTTQQLQEHTGEEQPHNNPQHTDINTHASAEEPTRRRTRSPEEEEEEEERENRPTQRRKIEVPRRVRALDEREYD